MEYLKKDNESDFDYIRLVEGKSNGIYDIDYVELFISINVDLAPDDAETFMGLK